MERKLRTGWIISAGPLPPEAYRYSTRNMLVLLRQFMERLKQEKEAEK
jgi:hypothetical protein